MKSIEIFWYGRFISLHFCSFIYFSIDLSMESSSKSRDHHSLTRFVCIYTKNSIMREWCMSLPLRVYPHTHILRKIWYGTTAHVILYIPYRKVIIKSLLVGSSITYSDGFIYFCRLFSRHGPRRYLSRTRSTKPSIGASLSQLLDGSTWLLFSVRKQLCLLSLGVHPGLSFLYSLKGQPDVPGAIPLFLNKKIEQSKFSRIMVWKC